MTQPQRIRDFIGPYQIGNRLGGGAFSSVYQACDPESGRTVAVKLLEHDSALPLAAFRTEFQSVQDLHHPNIVRLETLLEHDGWTAIVMELVPGTDLLSYVRPSDNDGTFDEARVRSCFTQLASALSALHEVGVVHRDIKPRNVRVTPEGRVVLLDFGLIKHMTVRDDALDEPFVGTADYNAPEQVKGGAQGPPADLYALGVCLFEAVAGVRPFRHPSPFEVMRLKQERDAPLLSKLAPRAHDDFRILCWRLLQRDDSRRPSAREVVEIFEGRRSAMAASFTLTEPPPTGPRFLGREAELSMLRSALFGAPTTPRLWLVEGESGVGKSALVAELLRELEAARPTSWVGRSRCYENERLALKAFDGAMAFFGRKLSLLSESEQRDFLPAQFTALSPLFPALAAAPRHPPPAVELPADPSAQKRFALEVLALLLEQLGTLGPVVLAIDDLQWADPESLRLLEDLARAEHGPWLVATVRRKEERSAEVQGAIESLVQSGHARLLSLDGLADSEARKLARRMLGPEASDNTVRTLVRESHGHPLWLQELSRFALRPEVGSVAGLTLDDALHARLDALSREQQALVELVAVAAQPYPTLVLARALGIEESALHALAIPLLSSGLLRRRGDSDLACFHDRVRAVAAQRVRAPQRAALHAALARALSSQPRVAQADIARHFDAAGLHEDALAAYQQAGDHALLGLAFDDAVHHYLRALELGLATSAAPGLLIMLRTQSGRALAHAGRSAQGAQLFLEAAEHAEQSQRIELRIWAAQHLLQSGHFEEGQEIIRDVLASLGESYPESQGSTLASVLYSRLVLRIRGFDFERREASCIDPEVLQRVDALCSAGSGFSMTDPIRSASFMGRWLLAALRAGEPYRVASALSMFSMITASGGGPARAQTARQLNVIRSLLKTMEPAPFLDGLATQVDGFARYFVGEWNQAAESLLMAEQALRNRSVGATYHLSVARLMLCRTQIFRGAFTDLSERAPAYLREADQRGDLYASVCMRSNPIYLLALVDGDLEQAEGELATAELHLTRDGFQQQHLYCLAGRVQIDLYRGDAAGAHQRWIEAWPKAKRGLLLRVQATHINVLDQRARAALSLAATSSPPDARLLCAVEADIRTLHGKKMPWSSALATLLSAGVARTRGDQALALAAVSSAADALESVGMGLHAAAARRRQGELLGGDGGRALLANADAWMHAQGIRDVARITAVYAPGFGG